MRRKIIKLGQATYVASLPSKWIREHNLEKGDYLECEDVEGNLIFSTQKISLHMEVTINLSNSGERTIRNILNQTYRKGFDQIKLKFTQLQQLDIIREIVRETLLGFEIVREETDFCVVENIAEPSAEKFDIILRRLFLSIKQEGEELLEELQQQKVPNLERQNSNKNIVDNYTNFIRRLIIKNKIKGARDSYLLYYGISLLSLIHHGYFYLRKSISEHQRKALSMEFLSLLKETNALFETYYQAFYRNDLDLADHVQISKQHLMSKIYKSLLQKKGIENVALCHLAEIIRMIQMSSTTFFGLYSQETKT